MTPEDPDLSEINARIAAKFPNAAPPPSDDNDNDDEPITPGREYDPSLMPDDSWFESRPQSNNAVSHLKEDIDQSVSLADVYDHFVGKKRKNPKPGQRDGIHMSCPSPTHPDNHPSAWYSIEGLWYCGSCGAKGDIYTIAGLQLGLDSRSKDFVNIVTAIADAFNIDYMRSEITGRLLEKPSTATRITVTPDEVIIDPPPEKPKSPLLDWKKIFPEGTFGRTWMEALKIDDLPEEYYVWCALLAIGLALGRDTYTPDSPNIYGNLYIVLFGSTGVGKSRAMRHLTALLKAALPYDINDPSSKGAFVMPMPASPEALVDQFSRPIYNPDNEKEIVGYGSVRGLISVDEFSSLLSKSEQSKGGLKAQFTTLYDAHDEISLHSRGHGTVRAMYPFCSVMASTQPTAIRTSLGYNDLISGYLNRHVFVVGTPKRLYSMNRPEIDISEAHADLANIRAWSSRGRRVRPDDAAAALYDEFFRTHIELIDYEEDPMLARISLTLRKIMLLLAANERSEVITVEIVQRAIKMHEYLVHCYKTIADNVVSSANNDLSEWLTGYCRDYPIASGTQKPGPTLRDIKRALPKRFDNKQLLEGLSHLELIGIVVPYEGPKNAKGGRPTKRYVYLH